MIVHHSLVDPDLQRLHDSVKGHDSVLLGAEPLPSAFPFALDVLGMHGSSDVGRLSAIRRLPPFLPLDELDELP